MSNYIMLIGTTPVPNPNFPVVTVATINHYHLPPDTLKIVQDWVAPLVILGKTDGVAYVYNDTSSSGLVVYRNWIDTNTANEWILLVTSLNDPLIVDNKFYT